MAKRDVELIVRAKDEASRALSSIAAELDALRGRQDGASTSSKGLGASLVQAAAQMAKFEQVTGLVVAASDRAEAALAKQRADMAETAAQLAAVNAQMASARAAIEKTQTGIVNTRLGGGDTTAQVAQLQAAVAALAGLEGQQRKLSSTIAAQQAGLGQQEGAFRELASMAISAESALESFGDEAQRQALRSAAASDAAKEAFREEAAAAREAVAARSANARFSTLAGVRDGPVKSASDSAAVFQEAEQFDRRIQSLLDRTDPLAAIQRQLAKDIDLARAAMQRGAITAQQYATAEAELTRQSKEAEAAIGRVGRGERGKVALFGLKPYELTNLGYQVNDLITQVASGTPIMQAFAQQGGQILQILPGIGGSIISAFRSPPILLAAAALVTVGVALNRAADNAKRLERVEAMLIGIGDGANAAAREIAGTVKAMESLGLSADEALGVAREFISRGLDVSQMKAFAQAAKDTADATGVDLKTAMEDMTEGLTRGYQAVAELDNKLQFLTVAEREQIRVLFESGNATEARTLAVRLYEERMDDMASKTRGEWTRAVQTRDRAFDKLIGKLGDTEAARGFIRLMDQMADRMNYLLSGYDELSLKQVNARIAEIEADKKRSPGLGTTGEINLFGGDSLDAELAKLKERKALLDADAAKRKNFNDEESAAQKKRDADALRDIDLENRKAKARTAATRVALAGEEAYQKALDAGYSQKVALAKKELAIDKARADEATKATAAAKAAAAEQTKLNETITLRSPLKGNFPVTSGFSYARRNPVSGKVKPHLGTDFGTPIGTPVFASAAGVVTAAGPSANKPGGNGKYVIIDHGKGTKTTLLHLSDNDIVKEGDIVESGQLIGKTGNTGASTGPHLDFRVTVDGKPVDPLSVIGKRVAGNTGDAVGDAQREAERKAEDQDKFNREIDQEVERRKANTSEMQKQARLSGEALLDAEREAAVAEAVQQRRQQAEDRGLSFDQKRQTALEAAVRAEFDITRARERATAAISDNSAERDALLKRIELAQKAGDTTAVKALENELVKVDKRLLDGIAKAEAFWKAMGNNPQSRAALLDLETQRGSILRGAADREQARIEAPIENLQGRRSGLMQQIEFFRQSGQASVVEQLTDQLRGLDAEYLVAIDRGIAFWKTQSGPEAAAAILNLQNLRNELLAAQNEFAITGGQIRDVFAGSLTDSFKLFAQRLVETKDVLGSLGTAVLSFAASFVQKLAEMALQALALKTASAIGFGGLADGLNGVLGLGQSGTQLVAAGASLSGSGAILLTAAGIWQGVAAQLQAAAIALTVSGGAGGGASGAGSGLAALAGLFHEGGVAGMATRRVAVNPAWFANATRYHGGGIAGLKPDEVPAILRRGEEVLTTADARHRANINDNAAGGPRSLSQVLAIGDAEIASAVAGAAGEKVVLTHLRRNREAVREMLNG